MSWSSTWEGRATDFVPDLLRTRGNPGRMALSARSALWEIVQSVGEHDASSWVRVKAEGIEDPDNPGLGRFSMDVEVVNEPGEIQQKIAAQAPVDLLSGMGSSESPTPDTHAQRESGAV